MPDNIDTVMEKQREARMSPWESVIQVTREAALDVISHGDQYTESQRITAWRILLQHGVRARA